MPGQTRITPCRDRISDRFPIASFVVQVPRERLFEIACATDPRLFHPDRLHERTPQNFMSTRYGGLMRAPAGEATYLVPPHHLKQFAGATRLYYALATYGGMKGEDPDFSVAPEQPEHAPCIQIAQDFTGRRLDRSRFGHHEPAEARYGGAPAAPLTWGGDHVAPSKTKARTDGRSADRAEPEYDDGYDKALWTRPEPATHGGVATTAPTTPGTTPRSSSRPSTTADLYADPNELDEASEPSAVDDGEFEDGYSRQCADGSRAPACTTSTATAKPTASPGAPQRGDASTYGAANAGYEDAPDIARNRAPSAALRYGRGAASPRAVSRAQTAEMPPVVPAAGDAEPAPSAPAPAINGDGSLPGRSIDYSDVWIAETDLPVEAMRARVLAAPQALSAVDRLRMIDLVARFESGPAGYAAVNADGEFNTPSLAQFQRTHVGLSWGYVQFTQRYGTLGDVLSACERRDPTEFARTFGDAADRLIEVTNAPTEDARLAPVADSRLWEEPWLGRFSRAGGVAEFQAAQREVADTYFFVPNLSLAGWLAFATDRALTMVFDRAVQMGRAGALRWIVGTVSPIRSQKQRAAALAALNVEDLPAFARSLGGEMELLIGPAENATWSTPVHAALLGALRKLGAGSPIAMPSLNEMLDALVRAARVNARGGDRFWTIAASRLATLRTTNELTDAPYQM